jgi:hypothetical protein
MIELAYGLNDHEKPIAFVVAFGKPWNDGTVGF